MKERSCLASLCAALAFAAAIALPGSAAARTTQSQPLTEGTHYTVYLLAGQSNMDGRGKNEHLTGELADYATPQNTVMIRYSSGGLRRKHRQSKGFIPLRPGCNENPSLFGPEIGFGHAIAAAQPGRNILLVKVTEGGTTLHTDWNSAAPNKLYARLVRTVKHALEDIQKQGATYEIAGMLWHQGEGDRMSPHVERYKERIDAFIERIRTDLNAPEMPFILGEIRNDSDQNQAILAIKRAYAEETPAVGLASGKDLKTFDTHHFDAPSLIELGKRYADELVRVQGLAIQR